MGVQVDRPFVGLVMRYARNWVGKEESLPRPCLAAAADATSRPGATVAHAVTRCARPATLSSCFASNCSRSGWKPLMWRRCIDGARSGSGAGGGTALFSTLAARFGSLQMLEKRPGGPPGPPDPASTIGAGRSSGRRRRTVAHRGQVARAAAVSTGRTSPGGAGARSPRRGSPGRGTARTAPGCSRRPW